MTTLVQSKYFGGYGGTGAGVTTTLNAAATTGNSICVTLVIPVASVITSLKTSTGQDLTLDKAAETSSTAAQNILFYSVVGITGSPTGIVLKLAADATVYVYAEEVSGMASTLIVDANPTRSTGSSTTPTISVTTATANAYIRYLSSYGSKETFTAGAGYTANDAGLLGRHGQFNVNVGAAGAKSVTATINSSNSWAVSAIAYKTGAVLPAVSTVSSESATEGSSIAHTVTLGGSTSGITNYGSTLTGVTATGDGTDFTSDLASATYSNGVTFSGGNMVVPDAVSTWTVTISTASDAFDEIDETYTLTIEGVSGTGAILDDDAAPVISGTASVAVSAGANVVITYTLSAASGKSITATLAVIDGTAVGGVDYTNTITSGMFSDGVTISGATVTIPAGVASFTLTIPTA